MNRSGQRTDRGVRGATGNGRACPEGVGGKRGVKNGEGREWEGPWEGWERMGEGPGHTVGGERGLRGPRCSVKNRPARIWAAGEVSMMTRDPLWPIH